MKKELEIYDTMLGLYWDWSYCHNDKMWYEDAKEVMPLPLTESEKVSDFELTIYIDYTAYGKYDDFELQPENELNDYAQYIMGVDNSVNCVGNIALFRTQNQTVFGVWGEYGIWDFEDFINKLKEKNYATQYIEEYNALKLTAWTLDNNETRFIVQSYCDDDNYKIFFDITVDKNLLIEKSEKIVTEFKTAIYDAIIEQEKLLNRKCTNQDNSNAIKHFFPEFSENNEEQL